MKEKNSSTSLLNTSPKTAKPVTCLGLEFPDDAARRAWFTEELRKKLQDPEFRKIEGFPIGEDEDILALSDPPYYTACPNPWLGDFIAEWEAQKPPKPEGWHYHREPFAADVSEGKNDPIYNAHSYHTKVPHKAIMRYILHYTEPGDIVFDGFCGTGMTGVAAQMCGDKEAVQSLGYQVRDDGTIWGEEQDENGKPVFRQISRLGARRAALNDLSPAATFIAYNYNTPVNVREFEKEARRILAEVEDECGWMYETWHIDEKTGEKIKGKINYTVWSDVFICPDCAGEVVFWDAAVDKKAGKVRDSFPCPHCSKEVTKRDMERAWITKYDKAIGKEIKQAKQVPVLINYTVEIGGKNKRFEKEPDDFDYALLKKIENVHSNVWIPNARMPEGKEARRNDVLGMTHVHLYFSPRNLQTLSNLWNKAYSHKIKFLLTSLMFKSSYLCGPLMSNYFAEIYGKTRGGWVGKDRSGTLYCPSIHSEVSIFPQILTRSKSTIVNIGKFFQFIISTSDISHNELIADSIDYVFLDPPFGSNINYSELSYLWEAWLGVFTDNKLEAIEDNSKGKDLNEYRKLMAISLKKVYFALKPGHWLTIEFSNTKAYIWNIIQAALSEAGFIVANVASLNKKQGSINAYTTPTAVKQDLVISAYKPNGGFEERFLQDAETEEGVWDFIRSHLRYLPITRQQGAALQAVTERDPRILFDQMVAYHVRKGYLVPISSQDFQAGLGERFDERDGMYFLPEQAAEYDRKKAIAGEVKQTSLFVEDEASAIQWLRQLLREKPQKFSDINPLFMQQLNAWKKNETQLDLRELLEQNFLIFKGDGPVPPQIHSYLSSNWPELRNLAKDDPILKAKAEDRWYVPDPKKAGDLEKLRERALLKDFEEYKQAPRKLKVFRIEAVRAGFRKAWQENDYATIIAVAKKLPASVLDEDPKLLMWHDQALTRLEAE